MTDRVILHCDCNSFFASVEAVLNPEYKKVPMAVCGSEENRHGIVLAKNDLAKAYGIVTAETVYSAKKKCPGLVIAAPHHEEYVKYSVAVNNIYRDYTDLIEPFGIDESWLDVTASKRIFGSGVEIADTIRKRVREELGITVSVGVSFNKVFAKLGSDYKKPDATTVISRDNFREIVFPLSASDLLYVGKRTAYELSKIGVKTIGQLASMSPDFLERKFGKLGKMLHVYSNGFDDSPVCNNVHEDTKSVSNSFTFKHNLISEEDCRTGIAFLSDEIGRRLREKGLKASTVSITIKDEFLQTVQTQGPLASFSDISREISNKAFELFSKLWTIGKPIRMITVNATGLTKSECVTEQLDLFEDNSLSREKERKREETIDLIKNKFGDSSIFTGAVLDSDIGVFNPKTKNNKR